MRTKVFVEIGVCDFDTLEPLQKNGWQGYYVEPVEEYANKIKGNVTQCAISSYDGMIDFYVSKTDGEEWQRGISHAVEQEGTKILELKNNRKLIDKVVPIPCYTLHTFLRMKDIWYVDYLKVDTEGHETDIFQAYDWSVYPTFIKLEHFHINDIKMKSLLEKHGYIVYTENRDMYAVR